MRKLALLGAGTFAVEVLDAVELLDAFEVVAFVVSERRFIPAMPLEGRPVVSITDLHGEYADVEMIAGIVTTKRRRFIEDVAARGCAFAAIVHPAAAVSRRAAIARGTFVGAGAIVAATTRIGPHVVVNRGANLGHDITVGAYSTIGPGATVAGAVAIGEGAYVGVGAVIRDHLTVGDGAVVAAGAVVVRPVAARTLVAGCPAVVVRENVDGL